MLSTATKQARHEAVIAALVAGRTSTEAASEAGVSVNTVYRYLRDPKFRLALSAAQAQQWAPAATRLRASVDRAIEKLEALMDDDHVHASTQLRAAVSILEMALKFKDVTQDAPVIEAIQEAAAAVITPAHLDED